MNKKLTTWHEVADAIRKVMPFDRMVAVDAAKKNKSIIEFRQSQKWWTGCWSEDAIAQHPPLRVEFEYAIVFGSIYEAFSVSREKASWGAFVKVEPLRPDDELHPTRICYVLKAENKMRQRWEFRDTLKNILGKNRRLVNDAMRLSKREFLADLTEEERSVIFRKLELDAADFWRAVRRGDRFGANGIQAFVQRLRERTEGYRFDFDKRD